MFQGCFLWDRTSRVCLQLKLTQSAMFSLVQKWCKNRGTKCIIFYEYAMQGFGSVFLHALQPLSSILALCSQVSPWLHLCRMQDEEQTVKSPNNLTPKSSKNCFLSQVTVFLIFVPRVIHLGPGTAISLQFFSVTETQIFKIIPTILPLPTSLILVVSIFSLSPGSLQTSVFLLCLLQILASSVLSKHP